MKNFTRILFFLLLCAGSNTIFGQASFTAGDTAGCAPFHLFTATETDAGVSRVWQVKKCNGTVITTTLPPGIPTFNYILPGPECYDITLTSTNAAGVTSSYTFHDYIVAALPVANYTLTPAPAPYESCLPLQARAVCNSTAGSGTIVQTLIDWGCGAPSQGTACNSTPVIHNYTNCPFSCLDVKVAVKNSYGCAKDSTYICAYKIIHPPIANFIADTTSASCTSAPLPVHFSADSAGPNITYCWYINGAQVSCGTNRFFNYTFPVTQNCYDVALSVHHPSGCFDSIMKAQYICVRTSPQVTFTVDSPTACVNSTHCTTVHLAYTGGGNPSITWSPSCGLPATTGLTTSYTICTPGICTITVTAVYGPGCTRTATQTFFTGNARPVSDFTASQTTACSVPFTTTFTPVPACATCAYSWNFLAGSPVSSTATSPSVTWNTFGQFNVALTTIAQNGCTDALTKFSYIKIGHIVPQISSTKYKGCGPLCPTFTNTTNLTGIPPLASVCWSFPGSTIPGACQTGPYSPPCLSTLGCDTVKLTLTTTTGCVESVVLPDTLCVGVAPICTVTANPQTVCYEADTVGFSMNCNHFDYVKVLWGDAQPPGTAEFFHTPNFTHVFRDTGLICNKFIPMSDSCARDTLITCVQVNPPVAKFTFSTNCLSGNSLALTNQSLGATSYLWHFCDGTTSTTASPSVALPPCDTCNIRLETFNSATGCHHQVIHDVPTPCDSTTFANSPTEGCAPFSFVIHNTNSNAVAWQYNFDTATCGLTFNNACTVNAAQQTSHFYQIPGDYTVAARVVKAGGCADTVYFHIKACKAKADFFPNTACFPAPICFRDSSTDAGSCPIVSWRWYFGDGGTSNLSNPCHTYAAPGNYQVSLAITNAQGCGDSIVKTATAAGNLISSYVIDTLVCLGNQTCVVNNSTGVNLSYQWTMPGATPSSSTAASPCFTYNTPGFYPVYYRVTSGNVCANIDTIIVSAHNPIAGSYADTNYIPCPDPFHFIQFHDTSLYNDGTRVWYFGDGQISTNKNPIHSYSFPGIYYPEHCVTTLDGCVDCDTIGPIIVDGPYGHFSAYPTPGICACKDSIDYSISTTATSSITLLYGCNVGSITANISPIGTDINPTTFNISVPYCLTDTCRPQVVFGNNQGCQVFLTGHFIYIDSPQVGFTFNNHGVCVTGDVCFHDTTRYHLWPDQSYTVHRIWDFGDNSIDSTSNDSVPCHHYAGVGGYVVKLFVQSNLNCFDSSVGQVVVVPEFPIAGYYADTSEICAQLPLCFHDTSYIYPLTGPQFWVYDFGDGTPLDTFYTPTACHAFAVGGTFHVSMCVTDSVGCSDCASTSVITVRDNPVSNAGPDAIACYGSVAQLTGTGGPDFHWQPANIVSDPILPNPTFQVTQDSAYTFTLTVINSFNCADTDTVVLNVAHVTSGFTVGATLCQRDSACVSDASADFNGTLAQWSYNFGDTTPVVTSNNPNVCHVYQIPGNFTITEVSIDNHGCTDTSTRPINVLPAPLANFSLNDTVICSNQQICITDLSTSIVTISSWQWNYGDGTTATGANPPCHMYGSPLQPTYAVSVRVTDTNNCWDTAQITVTVNRVPIANFTWNEACEDHAMTLSSTSSPGSGPVSGCIWTFWLGAPNPVTDSSCNTSFQFPAGTYNVQLVAVDLNGCTDTVVKTVKSDSLSHLLIYPGDTIICLGTSVDYHVDGVFDNIIWTPNVWLSDPYSTVVTINPLGNISYIVSATNGLCTAAKDTFAIRVIQPIPIEVTGTPQSIVLGLSSNLTSSIPAPIDSIVWTPDSTLDCRTCPNPVATPSQTTTYYATIYYGQHGVTCTNMAQVTIEVLQNCDQSIIFIPNTFTPNGDGLNDIFRIRGLATTKIDYFRVFDRWGRLVFETLKGSPDNPNDGWDGNDREGRKLNPGVYVYTYEIECINGNIVTGQGNVTLVR